MFVLMWLIIRWDIFTIVRAYGSLRQAICKLYNRLHFNVYYARKAEVEEEDANPY